MTSPSCTLLPKKVEVTRSVSGLTATARAAAVVAMRKSRAVHEMVMHEVAAARTGDSRAMISSARRTTQVCGDSIDTFKYDRIMRSPKEVADTAYIRANRGE